MLLIIDIDKDEYYGYSVKKQTRKIWLFPEQVSDIDTFDNLPGFFYCNMFSVLGEDEGRYISVNIQNLRFYLSRPVHKGPDYRVSYELVE